MITLKGYRRENGSWGIRNHLLVIPTSVCASETASRIAALVPGAVAKLCALCLAGDYPAARELYTRYAALFSALFIETNPIPITAAMHAVGMDSGILRLPLVSLSEDNLPKLLSIMRELGICS